MTYREILYSASTQLKELISTTDFEDEFEFIGFETDLLQAVAEFRLRVKSNCKGILAEKFPKKKLHFG